MRLIDADALKMYMRNALEETRNCYSDGGEWAATITEEFCKDIDEQPTIEERKPGRWIQQDHNYTHGNISTCMYYYPVCSECGHTGDFGMNFCPNCGSPMGVEHE